MQNCSSIGYVPPRRDVPSDAELANFRHAETDYDVLLGQGYDRRHARAKIEDQVYQVLEKWSGSD